MLISERPLAHMSGTIEEVPLWLLVELTNELSTAKNLETLQHILARKLRLILDFEQCTLAIQPKPADSEYLLLDVTSPSKAECTSPRKISLDEGWPGRVILESKPYFLPDLTQLPASIVPPTSARLGLAPKASSLMLLPLQIGERTIGSINFSSSKPRTYSTAWQNIASLLAAQVAGQLSSVLAQEQANLAMRALAVSQAKLKSAYEFRERVIESTTDAIYALDLEGNFTLINRRTAEIIGYSVNVLLGTPFLELFALSEAKDIQQQLSAIASDGVSVEQYDAELIRRDGSQQSVSLSLAPVLLEGEIAGVVGTLQGVTAANWKLK